MTDVDERLLTAAKLREQARGDLDGNERLQPLTGIISNETKRSNLSFVESVIRESDLDATTFGDTRLGQLVEESIVTDEATKAVHQGNANVMSHLVGITEQELDGSSLRIALRLNEEMENNGAPAFIVGAGNPNTGKTNLMSELVQLRSTVVDDLLVVSNVRSWELSDITVTSARELAVELIEHRETPKFVVIDEGSTHFDARTYRHEVATQWTPLAKRFAKIGVDTCGIVVHTGKDLHPEAKRLATLCYFKLEKEVVEFYERWPADGDYPTDRIYTGPVQELESTSAEYDPDDTAPWVWDLESEIFTQDLNWSGIIETLSK